MTEEFFREDLHRPEAANVFQFQGLNHELEMMQSPPPQQQQMQQPKALVAPNNWANDYMQHQHVQTPQQLEEFESIYQQNQHQQPPPQQQPIQHMQHMQPMQGKISRSSSRFFF
jgi:hypothetical protein